jgi:hypothetical protein
MQISDGVKKWSILLPTYPLPARWRVAARRKGLANLEVAKAQRASVLIIGHPKSGNTWLKAMISRLYQVRHGLAANELINTDELALKIPEIPRLAASNGWYSYEGAIGEALAAGGADNPLRHKPVLLIARNPLDIAVSWYFQFTKRQSKHKQELINHSIAHPIDRNTVEMWEFVRHSDIGLPSLIEFLNTWARNLEELEHSQMIRYEDLRGKTAQTLRQVIDLMGETFSDEDIAGAVEWGSFDNLRKLESNGFFKRGGMTLRNPDDPNSFKVRRGKVGGYRDYFSPEQAAELETLMTDSLLPVFGYGPALDAVEKTAEGAGNNASGA